MDPEPALPLDPAHLTPPASLNRVPLLPLSDLPGAVPPGTKASAVLGASGLQAAIGAHAAALGLPAAALADRGTLFQRLDACFVAPDPAVRGAALAVAREYAGHLAHLLLTLLRGEPASRAARPEWDASYWAQWAAMRHVWLGGGLMSGHLGQAVEREVAAQLRAHGAACTVAVAAHPRLLPLIGAARSVPPGHDAALVWDLGSTAIKRAHARYGDGALAELRLQPPVPSDLDALAELPPGMAPRVLGARLVDRLAADWTANATGGDLAPVLSASMACYVRAGQPLTRQFGLYSELNTLSHNLADWLAAGVSARVGQPLTVQLIHDGSAAARTFAGQHHAAVIMLGTWLGVGYVPPAGGLRPLAPDFAVIAAPESV